MAPSNQGKMPSSTTAPLPYFPPPPRSAALANSKSKLRSSSLTAKSSRSSKSGPSALHRSRTFLVPILLIVTFAIIVLSVIFGYCVSTPHTQVTAGNRDSYLNSTASSSNSSSSSESGTTQEYSPTAALVFYLLTCPVALLCLLSVELILHHHYYYFHGNGGKSSLLSSRSIFNINARFPSFFFLLIYLITSLAFTLSTSFWTACEIPPPTSTALDRLCPAQVRGHFMYGIHELSIAKVAMGWAVVVGLILHIWCQVKARRAARHSRRIRWAIDSAQTDYGKADVEVVTIDERDSETGSTAAAAAAAAKMKKKDRPIAGPLGWWRGSPN